MFPDGLFNHVVETAIHDKPIISLTIDTPGGWNMKDVYSLP